MIHLDFARKVELTASKIAKKASEKHLNYTDSMKLYNELFKHLDSSTGTYHLFTFLSCIWLALRELVGLAPDYFNFKNNKIYVYQSWNYKDEADFGDLKNTSSEQTISNDKRAVNEFKKLILSLPENPCN